MIIASKPFLSPLVLDIVIAMENDKKEYKPDPSLSDRLLKNRTILISGEINKDKADEFTRQILVLDSESSDPIYVYINSPGGDVDSGFAIYDMARFVSSPVTMIGMGLVASAAALIYLAVPAERRLALPDSTYLIHQPLSQLKGVAIDVAIYADKIAALRKKLDKVIADLNKSYNEALDRDVKIGKVKRLVIKDFNPLDPTAGTAEYLDK